MAEELSEWDERVRDRLSAALKAKGLNQKALAEHFGVTESAVSYWMNRLSEPGWEGLAEFCRFVDVSADYVLGLASSDVTASVAEAARLRAENASLRAEKERAVNRIQILLDDYAIPVEEARRRRAEVEAGQVTPAGEIPPTERLAQRPRPAAPLDHRQKPQPVDHDKPRRPRKR